MGEVVDQLVEAVVTAGGRAGEGAEGGYAGDADCGTDGIVGGSFEVAVGELCARLVDGARGQDGDVADGESLVEVFEAGRGTGIAYASCAAGVLAGDAEVNLPSG